MPKATFLKALLPFIALNAITVIAQNAGYLQPTCPPNFRLLNGLCYPISQLPTQNCPDGYYLSNNLCYRINPVPCPEISATTTTRPSVSETTTWSTAPETTTWSPAPETTTWSTAPETTTWSAAPETTTWSPAPETTTWSPEPETTTWSPEPETTTWSPEPETTTVEELIPDTTIETVPEPEPAPISLCPTGSILTDDGFCRKVYCTQGEYYERRCLQPVCPDGTVWRGKSCQSPTYITTILEIENIFHNEVRERPGLVVHDNKNNVYYHNVTTTASPSATETTTTKTWTTQRPPIKPKPTVAGPLPNVNQTNPQKCCSIITPRICKRYGAKWVCFNRRYRRCDTSICLYPIIYLKTPKIVYDPPVLIMPPNPPLQACVKPGCDAADSVDCSGCAHNLRDTCSTYCYHYMCPSNACTFIDQQRYCSLYPGEPGCTKEDGCLWDWCGEKC